MLTSHPGRSPESLAGGDEPFGYPHRFEKDDHPGVEIADGRFVDVGRTRCSRGTGGPAISPKECTLPYGPDVPYLHLLTNRPPRCSDSAGSEPVKKLRMAGTADRTNISRTIMSINGRGIEVNQETLSVPDSRPP